MGDGEGVWDCGRSGPTRRSLRRRLRDACPNREWGAPVGFERAQQALTESNAGDKGACVAKRVYVCQFWKKWRACHQIKSSRVKIEQNRVKLESRLQSGYTMVLMATATAANPLVNPPWQTPLQKPLKTFYKPFQTSIKPFKIVINVQGGGLWQGDALHISVGTARARTHSQNKKCLSYPLLGSALQTSASTRPRQSVSLPRAATLANVRIPRTRRSD